MSACPPTARAEEPRAPGVALSATVAGGWTSSAYSQNGFDTSYSGAAVDPRVGAGWRTAHVEVGATAGAILVPHVDGSASDHSAAESLYVLHGGAFIGVHSFARIPLGVTARFELARAMLVGQVAGAVDGPSHTGIMGASDGGLVSLSIDYAHSLTPSQVLLFGVEGFMGHLSGGTRHVEPRGLVAVLGMRWD